MDGTEISSSAPYTEKTDSTTNMDQEQFQKFMYELFDKNGVMNDLRAYLRKHIVEVLKSSQKGEVPSCQKHFTQRLELPSQAMNILLAEYFLRMEFSYSLSVFVSEIPLANMGFDFAKELMHSSTDNRTTGLQFNDKDIWAVLNFLGIKCDSEYACNVLQMYKTEKHTPLLLCIINCMNGYRNDPYLETEYISDGSTTVLGSEKSYHSPSGGRKKKRLVANCHHYSMCKVCQNKVLRYREKYKNKAKMYAKKQASITSMNGEILMKNMTIVEKEILDETMDRMRDVHEAEVNMLRNEQDQKVKRSLAHHAMQLQRRKMQLEESYGKRAAELERSMAAKKRFLWGLAKALREQHRRLARAMLAVTNETRRIAAKENNLKTQIAEAEEVLRQRGEDMRQKISHEMVELEAHVDNMKKERNHLQKERIELEEMKKLYTDSTVIKIHNLEERIQDNNKKINSTEKDMKMDNEDLRSSYDMLRNEISKLKRYIETCKPKSMTEKSTVTDLSDTSSKSMLNNEQEERHVREDLKPPNQVVNDFKKQKNVNFDQLRMKVGDHKRGLSPTLSEAGDGAASPGHSPNRSPAHSPSHSPGRSSGQSRSPSPRTNTEFTVIKPKRDSVRRKHRIRQIQIKVGDILEDCRNRSPTTSQGAEHNTGQSPARNTGHSPGRNTGNSPARNAGHSPGRNRSHNMSPEGCEPTILKILEDRENKVRSRRVKIEESCREYRDKSPTSDAGDSSTTHSPTHKSPQRYIKDPSHHVTYSNTISRNMGSTKVRSRSNSPPHREVTALQKLLEENERLKSQARQQEEQISSLASHQARLAAELLSVRPMQLQLSAAAPVQPLRPRTAPAALPGANTLVLSVNPIASATSMGWRKGAGEELSWFSGPQRILVPGDVLPFIGVLADRNDASSKRHVNVSRTRRHSPVLGRGPTKPVCSPHGTYGGGTPPTRHKSPQHELVAESTAGSSKNEEPDSEHNQMPIVTFNDRVRAKSAERNSTAKFRDISPKSVLREAKLKLRNKDNIKAPYIPREKSPTSVLREAKLRLRKLEIEAEAVEKSYMDFRKRQNELKKETIVTKDPRDLSLEVNLQSNKDNAPYGIEIKHSRSETLPQEHKKQDDINYNDEYVPIKGEFNAARKEYKIKFDLPDTQFKTRKPVSQFTKHDLIPTSYNNISNEHKKVFKDDYIEKPIVDFRKLYTRSNSEGRSRSEMERPRSKSPKDSKSPARKPSQEEPETSPLSPEILELEIKTKELMEQKKAKEAELEILKDNINKMYNLEPRKSPSEQPLSETSKESGEQIKQNEGKPTVSKGNNDENKAAESGPISTDGRDSGNTTDVPDVEGGGERISPNMTIIISPKRSPVDSRNQDKKRSVSPEQAAKLTRNDVLDAIFHKDGLKETSSIDMEIESRDDQDTPTDAEQDPPEYQDDFSADVDNYNSRSDEHSPVSLPKPPEDESFWDS